MMKQIILSLILIITSLNQAGQPLLSAESELPTVEYIKVGHARTPSGGALVARHFIGYPSGTIEHACYKVLSTGQLYLERKFTGSRPRTDKPIDPAMNYRLQEEIYTHEFWNYRKTRTIFLIRPAIPADAKPKSCCTLQ